MGERDRKRDDRNDRDELHESAPAKERFADQQFGATAARDQEELDTDDPGPGVSGRNPRAGNKAEPR